MVVLRLISAVMTPPAVSMPKDKGATSSKSRSWTASDLSPYLKIGIKYLN
jgi:hypothetical protein